MLQQIDRQTDRQTDRHAGRRQAKALTIYAYGISHPYQFCLKGCWWYFSLLFFKRASVSKQWRT